MARTYEFRLREMTLPDGEIAVADLGTLCARLQDLSTKVSRWVADIAGAGRGPRTVEAAATLTLSSISSGSTVLEIRSGARDRLAFDMPFEAQVSDQFWGIVSALGTDAPPSDAPTPVRESAVSLLDALQRTAPLVEVSRDDGARVEFRPAERDRSVWDVPGRSVDPEPVTVVGRLEAVDLRSGRFRVADDVGNRIPLQKVENAEHAAHLIKSRVAAVGLPERDARGRLTAINAPTLEEAELPATVFSHVRPSNWEIPADYAGPDPDGGVELDDTEWHDFLQAVKDA